MDKIPAVALFVSIIAVVVSVIALICQLRRSKFSLGVELLQKLDERFNCPDFYKKRKAAIESIKSKTFSDIHEILDFFETIGLLLKRRAVDKEMVWSTFYWWIYRYYYLSKDHIEQKCKETNDHTYWQDFRELFNTLNKYDKKRRTKKNKTIFISKLSPILSEKEVQDFYDGESL